MESLRHITKTVIKNDTPIINHPHQGTIILDVGSDGIMGGEGIVERVTVVEP